MVAPKVVLTYDCSRSLPSRRDGVGARQRRRTPRRYQLAVSTRFVTRARAPCVALHVGAMGVYC